MVTACGKKGVSDEERAQVKEALMVTMIRCIADRGLIHSSIDVLCGKVGISKTFFYSFFSSKEELCSTPCDISSPGCWIMPGS